MFDLGLLVWSRGGAFCSPIHLQVFDISTPPKDAALVLSSELECRARIQSEVGQICGLSTRGVGPGPMTRCEILSASCLVAFATSRKSFTKLCGSTNYAPERCSRCTLRELARNIVFRALGLLPGKDVLVLGLILPSLPLESLAVEYHHWKECPEHITKAECKLRCSGSLRVLLGILWLDMSSLQHRC